MRFLHRLRCLFFWRTYHVYNFWCSPHAHDGSEAHYHKYHLVLPWFCGLRIPVALQSLRDIMSGWFPFIDIRTGDELLWWMGRKGIRTRNDTYWGRWLSVLSEGNFDSLKEVRKFWAAFEKACSDPVGPLGG